MIRHHIQEATSLTKRQEMLTANMAWKSEAFLGTAGAHSIGWVSAREQGRSVTNQAISYACSYSRSCLLIALFENDGIRHP